MSETTSKPVKSTKPNKKRGAAGSIVFDESPVLIYRQPDSNREAQREAIGSMIKNMRASKQRGDVMEFLKDFRDNPRG